MAALEPRFRGSLRNLESRNHDHWNRGSERRVDPWISGATTPAVIALSDGGRLAGGAEFFGGLFSAFFAFFLDTHPHYGGWAGK